MKDRLKSAAKGALASAGMLQWAQEQNYRLHSMLPNTSHPRVQVNRVFKRFIRSGDLVFDVGANHGELTQTFLEVAPNVRIVSIDPLPHCIADLRERFAGRPVTVEWCAVGDEPGRLPVFECDDDRMTTLDPIYTTDSRFAGRHQWHEAGAVDVTTLDALIEKHGVPGYCKIDTEGFEPRVLAGLSTPIRCVSVEFHSEGVDRALACIDRLCELGNYKFNAVFGQPTALAFSHMLPADEFRRRWRQRIDRDPQAWGDIFANLL
jgi:FkbM family methyltransferase